MATVIVTAVFASMAIPTPPRSGPFCTSSCVLYPYVDVARFVPGDYFWLVPGVLLAPVFVVLMACVHAYARDNARIFSRVAVSLAVGYATVIIVDYAAQLLVVAPSLQAGETQGLSLFTQYNPHGFFIALEAIGYLLMSAAFLFTALVFVRGALERVMSGFFTVGFVSAVGAFVGLWVVQRNLVAFEVAVLMIDWVVLLVTGVLLTVIFYRSKPAGHPVSTWGGGSRAPRGRPRATSTLGGS